KIEASPVRIATIAHSCLQILELPKSAPAPIKFPILEELPKKIGLTPLPRSRGEGQISFHIGGQLVPLLFAEKLTPSSEIPLTYWHPHPVPGHSSPMKEEIRVRLPEKSRPPSDFKLQAILIAPRGDAQRSPNLESAELTAFFLKLR